MASKILNRLVLREEAEAAEKAGIVDETKKTAKKATPRKSRKKEPAEIRVKLFWGVFNQSLKRVCALRVQSEEAGRQESGRGSARVASRLISSRRSKRRSRSNLFAAANVSRLSTRGRRWGPTSQSYGSRKIALHDLLHTFNAHGADALIVVPVVIEPQAAQLKYRCLERSGRGGRVRRRRDGDQLLFHQFESSRRDTPHSDRNYFSLNSLRETSSRISGRIWARK